MWRIHRRSARRSEKVRKKEVSVAVAANFCGHARLEILIDRLRLGTAKASSVDKEIGSRQARVGSSIESDEEPRDHSPRN
ncbi:hypothetical protein MRX96_051586 [Rhipicephalus microplus]